MRTSVPLEEEWFQRGPEVKQTGNVRAWQPVHRSYQLKPRSSGGASAREPRPFTCEHRHVVFVNLSITIYGFDTSKNTHNVGLFLIANGSFR